MDIQSRKTIAIVLVFLAYFSLGHAFEYQIRPIDKVLLQEMTYSWKENNPVPLKDLRCVSVSYFGYDEKEHQGQLIVHSIVAEEIVDIFKELFEAQFPIDKMQFVDVYQGIDELSAQDNNTYAFCSRPNVSNPSVFSKHSYGLAIDINPLVNPYHKGSLIVPETGEAFLDRSKEVKGMILHDSICYQVFKKRGWGWGGDWMETKGYVDYQHFEKDPAEVLK